MKERRRSRCNPNTFNAIINQLSNDLSTRISLSDHSNLFSFERNGTLVLTRVEMKSLSTLLIKRQDRLTFDNVHETRCIDRDVWEMRVGEETCAENDVLRDEAKMMFRIRDVC